MFLSVLNTPDRKKVFISFFFILLKHGQRASSFFLKAQRYKKTGYLQTENRHKRLNCFD